ncbi:hypothetical protein GGR54DRAFT_32797 [Hypoxylon sp. NC1633]|nr:hypothetical protein GGR54DRAFT_32797 [Hypoxylon sp. NC1633]
MASTSQYHGSLIAFEGPQDAISTQLRLLPNSTNILIIPPLRHFIDVDPEVPFDARSHILSVHNACDDRVDIAWAFLRDSTPCNKRLVFMNGGTASAQTECVTDISKHLTNGDFAKAERIFNDLVRNGVAGLNSGNKMGMKSKSSQIVDANRYPRELGEGAPSDPASKAMRAADALDFKTACLQPNNEVDLTFMTTRPRSNSVPLYRMVDDLQSAAPFYIFGACKWPENTHDTDLPPSPRRSYTTQGPRKGTDQALNSDGSRMSESINKPDSPTRMVKEHLRNQLSPADPGSPSPRSFALVPTPTTTPAICEARAVDLQPPVSTSSHNKAKSVDRIYSSEIRNQDVLLCSFPQPPHSRPQSLDNGPAGGQGKTSPRSKFVSEIPRPTFSTPNRSVIRRSPPSPLKLRRSMQRPATYVDRATSPIRRNDYVDRGTDTGNGSDLEPKPEREPEPVSDALETDTEDSTSLNREDCYEPEFSEPHKTVLPMLENLVILFKGDKPESRLEATIKAFRDGIYPVSGSSSGSEGEEDPSQSNSSISREPGETSNNHKIPMGDIRHAEVVPACQMGRDEYDPFAYGNYLRPPHTWSPKQNTSSRRPFAPPTPAQTPPLTTRRSEKCFHDFTTTDCRTAVSMQNSLRSILNIYFPPEDAGYHQFNFPLLPELSSLWKPVFREAESGTVIKRKQKVDLILAIGAQQGVERNFLAAISGSLEMLGTKPNGVTRSGRLDLRFLIASAMQAFTSQPLANQTQDNPFSNPLLLATLIIPHLETYMAAHSATRFLLLEYPPEHLTTVLALQRLVGVDLLKVAGILDSEPSEAKPRSGSKGPSRINTQNTHAKSKSRISTSSTRTNATLLTPNGVKQVESPSFSKANFLLTSSANESDIATLISTIWKILIDISTFYIPEGMAPRASTQIDHAFKRDHKRESSHSRPLAQTPLINPTQQYATLSSAASMMGYQKQGSSASPDHGPSGSYASADPPPPIPSRRRGEPTKPEAPLKSSKGSISETIKSSRTVRTMRSQRNKLRNMLGKDSDADSTAAQPDTASGYLDSWDEEDETLFAEERKYIPLYGRESGPRKGNSRKALKWLGLAT